MSHKAVFLDRDDTLISDPGYITHPSQVKLLAGAGQSLAMLKKMGYLLVVVTNQSGVARGFLTEKALEEIHHHLKKLLADEGVYLDAIYHCPYHPEGTVEKYTRESDLRKPSPGMLLKAAEELDIDLSQSWMIGDSYRDIAAGNRAGCQTILLDTPGKPQVREIDDPEPDKRAVNLREAVNILRMVEFQQKAKSALASRMETPAEPETETGPEPVEAQADAEPTAPPPNPIHAPAAPEPKPQPVKPTASLPPAAVKLSETPSYPAKSVETKQPPKAEPVPAPVNKAEPSELSKPSTSTEPTHHLLEEILHRVKSKNRYDQFDEFSVFMLLAWLVQVLAAFSLVVSIWFWLDAKRGIETVQTMIAYAVALQLLVIALLLMHQKNK